MQTNPTRMSVQITDNIIKKSIIVPVIARSTEEASRRALANYCGESQSAASLHSKWVREGKLFAEVVEVGGDVDESKRSPCPGPLHPLNWLYGIAIWIVFVAFLYAVGVFDWLA